MMWKRKYRVQRRMHALFQNAFAKFDERLVQCARLLEKKTSAYSNTKKKLLLVVFVLLFVSQSTRTLIQSFKNKNASAFSVSRIKTVRVRQAAPVSKIDSSELVKIQGFKNYVDSLGKTAQGRKMRDSLFKNRPHLMDSVRFLLNLYSEQSNKIK